MRRARFAGSSPLTRGKRSRTARPWWRVGLIPAHAGKTCSPPRRTAGGWAHPRSRGENRPQRRRSSRARGSSPLTRGKPAAWQIPLRVRGLIPAHAGKTSCCSPCMRSRWAHPRSRGENALDFNANHTLGGSSPLTRGKHRRSPGRFRSPGLIPAHAGKTRAATARARASWAHPRSRGENLFRQSPRAG